MLTFPQNLFAHHKWTYMINHFHYKSPTGCQNRVTNFREIILENSWWLEGSKPKTGKKKTHSLKSGFLTHLRNREGFLTHLLSNVGRFPMVSLHILGGNHSVLSINLRRYFCLRRNVWSLRTGSNWKIFQGALLKKYPANFGIMISWILLTSWGW